MLSNCEVMAHYITGVYSEEPHTAREDLVYEVQCLNALLKVRKWREKAKEGGAYNYRKLQLRNNYFAK